MGNYVTIKYDDIANGPGCRVSLFLAGCDKRCPGCFNEEAWNFGAGKKFDRDVEIKMANMLADKPEMTGITILGGEPLHPNNLESTWMATVDLLEDHRLLCNRLSYHRPDVAVYTGYTFEELLARIDRGEHRMARLLENIDTLVDGPFIQQFKDISLVFRGSSNQRILDSRESLRAGKAIWTGRTEWLGHI